MAALPSSANTPTVPLAAVDGVGAGPAPAPMAGGATDAILMRLFEVSPDPISVTDLQTHRLIMVNEAFARLVGHPVVDMCGARAIDLGLWQNPQQRDVYMQTLARQGTVHDFQATFLDAHGLPLQLRLSASVFEQDQTRYLLSVMHDVTAHERGRLQYQAMLNHAMVGVAFTRDMHFQLANPRFEQMFGWPPGGLVGQPGKVVWPGPQAYDEVGQAARPRLSTGLTLDIERQMARRDGSVFWARMRACAVDPRDPVGGGAIWIVEDVTERREREQQLAAARDDAEAASRAKSAFLANTSHEIRTPLNGVLGLVRLALAEVPGETAVATVQRQREHLVRIQDSAQTLASIISDILDLSKIEAGHLALEQLDFDLHALLGALAQGQTKLARAKHIDFRLHLGEAVPRWVRGDPTRVRQILSNFTGNALKFTSRGSISLGVTALPAHRLRFTVRDTGCGVAPEQLPRLFKPFSQADDSTTREYGGTGLGLSICRQLAERMGGSVGVDSVKGLGSRFWVELALPPAEAPAQTLSELPAGSQPLAGRHVLLVEDNPVNTLVAEATLVQWGAMVSVARHGGEALAMVETAAAANGGRPGFDVVLMDLQMPVMGGIEATRHLRRQHPRERLPIIALTADVLVSERDAALQEGMNDFLPKPIDVQQLLQVLLRWMPPSKA